MTNQPNNPITVSENAKAKILSILDNNIGVRISVEGKGCAGLKYKFELTKEVQSFEQIIVDNDINLIIDPMTLIYIFGTELDYVESIFNSEFIFKNPNEKSKCGCGQSFSI